MPKHLDSDLEAILILMTLARHFNEFLFCLVWKDIAIVFICICHKTVSVKPKLQLLRNFSLL